MPRVAALILFFEKPRQTIACLESFLPSGAPIYVLNNGSSASSTEQVAAWAGRHPGVTMWTSPTNRGIAAGRNFLAEKTNEPWMFFCDSDARVTTADWSERLERHIGAFPDVEAFIPRIFNVHEGQYDQWGDVRIDGGVVTRIPPAGAPCNLFPGTSIVRRSMFERLGGYDEAMFSGFEDLEIAVRAIRSGEPVRGRRVDDIELEHDHRPALSFEDRRAAMERYDFNRIRRSYEHLLRKHGLKGDSRWTRWVLAERLRIAGNRATFLMLRGVAAWKRLTGRR